MSRISHNHDLGENYHSILDTFLEQEAPFSKLELELREIPEEAKGPLAFTDTEIKRARAKGNDFGDGVFGFKYELAYSVPREPENSDFEHPIGEVNLNIDNFDAFKQAVIQQVANIVARHSRKYSSATIMLKLFDGQKRQVTPDLIAELNGNPDANVSYVSTEASTRIRKSYATPSMHLVRIVR